MGEIKFFLKREKPSGWNAEDFLKNDREFGVNGLLVACEARDGALAQTQDDGEASLRPSSFLQKGVDQLSGGAEFVVFAVHRF
jgi:hypothetical protein